MKLVAIVFFWLLVCCSSDQRKGKAAKTPSTDTVAVKDGISKLYYDDGKLRAEIPMKSSRRNGLAKEFFKNGKVFQEITYVNGIKEGESKQYYEHGTLAQVTPYREGKRSGIQLRYRSDGALSAEVKYDNDNVCKGLVEYTLSGKKKKYPTIIVQESNTLLKDGVFTLHFSLSENNLQADFFIGDLDKSGCWNQYGMEQMESTGRGKAKLELKPERGEFLMTVINIVARVKTLQGNIYLAERKYNLSVEYR